METEPLPTADGRDRGRGRPEVFVADTDALMGDACAVLASGASQLLRAIDAGSALALMSEQAFLEVGRMSAKSARGYRVEHGRLQKADC